MWKKGAKTNKINTYHVVSENNASFLEGSSKLVLCDAPLILDVKKLESFCEESTLILCWRTLLLKFWPQISLKSTRNKQVKEC